jgi:3-oxoacyl-[acyl-carrier protein] reductase
MSQNQPNSLLVVSLKGKSALITGGSRGIGRAIALQYAACGADVCIIYRKSDKEAQTALEDILKLGVKGHLIKCDASDTKAAALAVAETIEKFGKIDILVNNVAISENVPFLSLGIEAWTRSVTVNINSMYNFTYPTLHHMRENKYGRILNVGSICGIRPTPAVPVHYATTKGAMHAFSFTLAKEVARYNILVNSIAPGLIATDLATGLPEVRQKDFERFCPLGRIGRPEEVAQLAAVLVSDLNSYMTGETVVVSGGL